MKLAIMQPYFFPYLGYFQLVNAADTFVFYDDVSFIKQGWINRNNILLNGKKYQFTIPVKSVSSFSLIRDTYISDKPFNWQKKFLSTIKQGYQKAPFFNDINTLIESIINDCCGQSIAVIAKKSIRLVLEYLSIQKVIVETSFDYNNADLKSEDRVLDICRKENADVYINAIGGRDIYSNSHFQINEKKLFFLKSTLNKYSQFENEFIPGLSIIDVLMFNSKEEIRRMFTEFTLEK